MVEVLCGERLSRLPGLTAAPGRSAWPCDAAHLAAPALGAG
jgi:hypothetical protein